MSDMISKIQKLKAKKKKTFLVSLMAIIIMIPACVLIPVIRNKFNASSSIALIGSSSIGRESYEFNHKMITTSSKEFIACGSVHGEDELIPFIAKFSSKGKKLWEKVYDEISFGGFSNILEFNNGDFLLIGNYRIPNSSIRDSGDIGICRVDNMGEIIWYRTFGGDSREDRAAMVALNDGSIIVSYVLWEEKKSNQNTPTKNFCVIKFNFEGTILWSHCYENFDFRPSVVVEDEEGNLNFVGNYEHSHLNFKTDGNGNKIEEIWAPIPAYAYIYIYKISSDNSIIVSGKRSIYPYEDKIIVSNLLLNGTIAWTLDYIPPAYFFLQDCLETTENDFIFFGDKTEWITGTDRYNYYLYLISIDNSGVLRWNLTMNQTSSVTATSICEGKDNYFMASATAFSGINQQGCRYLVFKEYFHN